MSNLLREAWGKISGLGDRVRRQTAVSVPETVQPSETDQKRAALRAEARQIVVQLNAAGLLPLEGSFRSESIRLASNLTGIENMPADHASWSAALAMLDAMAINMHRAAEDIRPTQESGRRGLQLQQEAAKKVVPVLDEVMAKLIDLIKQDLALSGMQPATAEGFLQHVIGGLKTYLPPTPHK